MPHFLELLSFAGGITLPCFIIVFIGWWLRYRTIIDDRFIEIGSRLIFTIALPLLLFLSITESPVFELVRPQQVIYGLLATIAAVLLLWIVATMSGMEAALKGVFVQGSFRGNMGIIGLALCQNMYGAEGLAIGSILLAFLTILYNILSIIVLTVAASQGKSRIHWLRIGTDIVKNPLIIAITVALIAARLNLQLPDILAQSARYFAQLTLPLALLCVGGAISFKRLWQSSTTAYWTIANKLIILPFGMTLVGYALGLDGILLGTLFLMFASPTATVSFIMVKVIGGDDKLAANIVATTTVLSIGTISAGILLFRMLGWV
ncbi:AEC family permease [Oleiphilus messinensis]|uniref:AEC family permease n=1 Tax=Oleiphilus messinensis TaxID=141451 RepID=A0A1Y0I2H2_9GAMM|nr:AEC family transporter [Oleiphilus messinensis]ARU54698.1 AEC family permease [Oleiphilus messinensis]